MLAHLLEPGNNTIHEIEQRLFVGRLLKGGNNIISGVVFLLIFPMADDISQSLDIPIYPFFNGLKIPVPLVVGENYGSIFFVPLICIDTVIRL